MSKECAYCGLERPPTNEHVLSACLLEKSPNIDAAKIDWVPDGFVGPDHTTKDVCGPCNHNTDRLGGLDDYICQLYDRYFDQYILPGRSIDFEYDFDLLARWLLKTAYNSSRASVGDEHTTRLAQHASYMIGRGKRPQNLALLLILVAPYEITSDATSGLDDLNAAEFMEKNGRRFLQPRWMGVNDLTFSDRKMDGVTAYLVIINSFYFVVCLFQNNQFRAKQALSALLSYKGIQVVPKYASGVTLNAPAIDFIEAVKLFGMVD